ncbi:RrF2 family transcriptional regulator [Paraburkholderia sp.]|uniref:RrF2 family transcriptional regulator n=1 Tax=Paraburkholderia sp. TaxID=1926495 RepID=UPI003D6DE85F
MRSDSRLSRMLHVLIHMDRHDAPMTSEKIAGMLCTHAVVVRRMLGGLRDSGYVQSDKGHGGGWVLTVSLDELTLLDVYRALGEPPVFALGMTDDEAQCLVEQAVNARLAQTLEAAEALLLEQFGNVTVGDIARDFEDRFAKKTRGMEGTQRAQHKPHRR